MERSLAAALWLGLTVAIGHGIGRFGYALLMPAMQADLHWGYEQASWINTANALGYIAGTASGVVLLRHVAARSLFRAGLWMVVASLPLMAVQAGFAWFLLVRVLSGLGAAWAFSIGGALVSELYGADARRKGFATGLFFGGGGLGMILTAAVVPALIELRGAASWPLAWVVLGVLSAAMLTLPLRVARSTGGVRAPAGAAVELDLRPARLAMLAYFGYAVSHTGYMLFIFAWAQAQHLPWFHGAGMWTVLGVGVCASAGIWQRALARWPAERTLAVCCIACAAGSGLPVLSTALPAVYASAALTGCAMFIGPASMVAWARQALPAPMWAKAIMVFSLVFALGQALGSWAFGRAADAWPLGMVLGAASAGLMLSAAVAFGAASVRRRPGRRAAARS